MKSSRGKPHLLLTSTVYYASKFMVSGEPRSYPNKAICKFVDWVSPMCFDFHGSWNNVTGLNSALYDPKKYVSTSYGIRSWIQAGVPPQKLVMGLPLYGRTWKLQDPSINGIGAPTVGVGSSNGTMAYFEILEFNNKTSPTVVYDTQFGSYYSYSGVSWIGYDDMDSVSLKIQFTRSQGLGGYFLWALGMDKDWIISRKGKTYRTLYFGGKQVYNLAKNCFFL